MLNAIIVIALLVMGLPATLHATNYYVRTTGNNTNDGKSITSAWKDLVAVNAANLEPGDTVFLESDVVYSGNLVLSEEDSGVLGLPVVVATSSGAPATVLTITSHAVSIYNCSYVHLNNITALGSVSQHSSYNGFAIYTNLASKRCYGVTLSNCLASGFRYGYLLGSTDSAVGYSDVRFTHCTAYSNLRAGFSSYGPERYPHENVTLSRCTAGMNFGDTTYPENNSGSGIVMGDISNCVITRCVAFDNGKNNVHVGGGPVGIWIYRCKDSRIEYCESFNNKAGMEADGGGFDIDGGCTNCVIEYCYSHNNEGSGYMFAEYGSSLPFSNNIIRYNISHNDARKNTTAGILLWAVNNDHIIRNSLVHNNVFVLGEPTSNTNKPFGIFLLDSYFENVGVYNNVFLSQFSPLVYFPHSVTPANIVLSHNSYYSTINAAPFYYGTSGFPSLESWSTAAVQERDMNGVTGIEANPLLPAATFAPVTIASEQELTSLTKYSPQAESPLINAGLSIEGAVKKDFFGNSVVDNKWSIGIAHQTVTSVSENSKTIPWLRDELLVPEISKPTNYRITDITGRTIESGTLQPGTTSVTIAALPTGMYALVIGSLPETIFVR